jgi:hypothetical protein
MQNQKVITVVVRGELKENSFFIEHTFPEVSKALADGYRVLNVHQSTDNNGKWVITMLTFILAY